MRAARYGVAAGLALALCLSGCVQMGQPVVAERSPVFAPLPQVPAGGGGRVRIYTVRKTDTLYSIAWRFQLDYQGFARANAIAPPYTIYPGQKLRLVTQYPSGKAIAEPARPKTQPPVAKRPISPPPELPKSAPTRWVWPLAAKPHSEFSSQSKGMNFLIAAGTTANVRSIGAGQVVYAGNGIGGFEHLIIVKHTVDLLSAYGFNGRRRVDEQQRVKAGDIVADIVNTGRKAQTLHFEVRRQGEPLNPRELLR